MPKSYGKENEVAIDTPVKTIMDWREWRTCFAQAWLEADETWQETEKAAEAVVLGEVLTMHYCWPSFLMEEGLLLSSVERSIGWMNLTLPIEQPEQGRLMIMPCIEEIPLQESPWSLPIDLGNNFWPLPNRGNLWPLPILPSWKLEFAGEAKQICMPRLSICYPLGFTSILPNCIPIPPAIVTELDLLPSELALGEYYEVEEEQIVWIVNETCLREHYRLIHLAGERGIEVIERSFREEAARVQIPGHCFVLNPDRALDGEEIGLPLSTMPLDKAIDWILAIYKK